MADKFFVMCEGRVAVLIMSNGELVKLCEKNPPDFFGEAGVMSPEPQKRTATIRAMQYTVCLEITVEAFAKYLSTAPVEYKSKLQLIMGMNMEKSLATIPFMRNLSESDLRVLASIIQYRIMAEKEILFHTGELGTEIYIVYSGNVSAIGDVFMDTPLSSEGQSLTQTAISSHESRTSRNSEMNKGNQTRRCGRSLFSLADTDLPDGKEQYIVKFKQGDFFGELGMVMGIPRTATVIADETSLLLALRKSEFHTFLKTVDIDFDSLMRSRSLEHLRNCCRHTFFNSLPEDKRFDILAEHFRITVWQPGKPIFRHGDPSDTLYLVAYGEVSIHDAGERESRSKGAILGATDVLVDRAGGGTYTSSVQAVDRTITLSISKEGIDACFKDQNPTARVDWDLKLLREECKIHHILHHPVGMKYFTKSVMAEHNQEMIVFWCQVRTFHERFEPPHLKKYPPYSEKATSCQGRKKDDLKESKRVMFSVRSDSKDLKDRTTVDFKDLKEGEKVGPGDGGSPAGGAEGAGAQAVVDEKVSHPDTKYVGKAGDDVKIDVKVGEESKLKIDPEGHLSNQEKDLMVKLADIIAKKYLEDNTILGMNVRRHSRNTIKKMMKANDYHYCMFSPAQHDIERVLGINSFMRFKRQSTFSAMCVELDQFQPFLKKDLRTCIIGLNLVLGEGSPDRVDVILENLEKGTTATGATKESPPAATNVSEDKKK